MANNFQSLLKTYFTNGALVEISSDDDGFRGAWYEGKVVCPVAAKKKAKKNDGGGGNRGMRRVQVVVEYDTLMADEAGTLPLQETVDIVQIRPRPPRERRRRFEFSDEVDAFYNDGWWEGVVTKVIEGGMYSVFFRATKEQLDFEEAELRLHREWADGEWKPPLEDGDDDEEAVIPTKQKTSTDINQGIYTPGMAVEVSSDEDGFRGAWFAATVVKQLDNGNYLIEYQSLRNDDDTEFLQEEVDHLHIRPNPPDAGKPYSFKLHEKVDAMYNDVWWVGMISEVLKGRKYIVYFDITNEELEFKHADLRPHQDWFNGKWITASMPKEKKSPSSRTSKSKR